MKSKKTVSKRVIANIVLFLVCSVLNIFVIVFAVGVSDGYMSEATAADMYAELISESIMVSAFMLVPIAATLIGGVLQGCIASLTFSLMSDNYSYLFIVAMIILTFSILRRKRKYWYYPVGCMLLASAISCVSWVESSDREAITLEVLNTQAFVFFLFFLAISTVYFIISKSLGERLNALFPKENDIVIKKNYRKRSIKTELILIVNTAAIICFIILQVPFTIYSINEQTRSASNTFTIIANEICEEFTIEEIKSGRVLSHNPEVIEKITRNVDTERQVEYIYISDSIFDDGYVTNADKSLIDAVVLEYRTDDEGTVVEAVAREGNLNKLQEMSLAELFEMNQITIYQNTWDKDGKLMIEEISIGFIGNGSINAERAEMAKTSIYLFLSLLIYVNIFANWRINKRLAEPISDMTEAVAKFAYTDADSRRELKESFDKLSIDTGDEIEVLYTAYGKTIADMSEYIDDIDRKSKQISKFQHNIIITMADIIESRDENTGGHIKRTAAYVEIIARKLQQDGKFPEVLTDSYINDMIVAAPLHDMGKIHVSDTILNKNGRLTDEEFSIMKSHTTAGKAMLENATETLGVFSYLSVAIDMANFHHEWWNGKGYPQGLSGEEIPVCARIMAVADVFDALISKRCYKDAMPLEKAYSIIREETGTHFDPVVAEAFFASTEEIEKALREFED